MNQRYSGIHIIQNGRGEGFRSRLSRAAIRSCLKEMNRMERSSMYSDSSWNIREPFCYIRRGAQLKPPMLLVYSLMALSIDSDWSCGVVCSLTVSPDVVPHDVKVVAIVVRVEAILHVICPTDTRHEPSCFRLASFSSLTSAFQQ